MDMTLLPHSNSVMEEAVPVHAVTAFILMGMIKGFWFSAIGISIVSPFSPPPGNENILNVMTPLAVPGDIRTPLLFLYVRSNT